MPNERLPVGKLPSALLERLLAAHAPTDPAVLVGPGIGRDAAAFVVQHGVLVAKSDPITFATEGAADYLVDINANDLACMGAFPRFLLVTALFPEHTLVSDVERTFTELGEACRRHGIALIGGHTEVSSGVDRPILVGMMLGEAEERGLIEPGQARPGDRLLMSGAIAVEGTALLARELRDSLSESLPADVLARARQFTSDPGISVTSVARAIGKLPGVRAMHDPTEGGLGMGVREIAIASECGAELELDRVPIHPETAAIASALGLDPLGMLASGSLLAAIAPESVGAAIDAASAAGSILTDIGVLTPEADGFWLVSANGRTPIPEWTTDEVSRAIAATSQQSHQSDRRGGRA
ncbi:MAG: AIR synthase-related protein [Thermomicrobiales bacterium]